MENKFYMEQIELWTTEKTNVIKYYARKLKEDKEQIEDMDGINEQGKKNLATQKEAEIEELRLNEIVDIENKIQKIKNMMKLEGEDKERFEKRLTETNLQAQLQSFSSKLEHFKQDIERKENQITKLNEKCAQL